VSHNSVLLLSYWNARRFDRNFPNTSQTFVYFGLADLFRLSGARRRIWLTSRHRTC